MSGKIKNRSGANADLTSGGVSCDERILRDCHQLYADPESGLITVAQSVGVTLLPPRKKITVMLMGNHSAGKSSFINWYVEEHIQRTGVAIETQGFSFVTSGRKRESLTGNATLHLYPHFKPLQEFKGVSEYLGTEVCTSRQKRFSLVTFVDSPGLVDGDMKYPFDVDEAIMWLGELCDLILVFFDPMGQALCKRTLNIVDKADEAGSESDHRPGACKRPGLNKCGFDMPTIYIPNPNKPSRCVNQIEEVCRTVEKTINQTVITEAIADTLAVDRPAPQKPFGARCKGCFMALLGFVVPLALLALLVLGTLSRELLEMALGPQGTEALSLTPRGHPSPVEHQLYACGGLVFLSFLLLILARFSFRTRTTLSGRQKRQLQEKLEYVQDVVKSKKKKLYSEYLRQSVGDQDMDM
uniref:G domain-containing protein n=1 Tax=Gadus morhua TaxID=8049 RepID=A0A8C4YYS9_GADMO